MSRTFEVKPTFAEEPPELEVDTEWGPAPGKTTLTQRLGSYAATPRATSTAGTARTARSPVAPSSGGDGTFSDHLAFAMGLGPSPQGRAATIASEGVRSANQPLPHKDAIARAFGRHDVSQIRTSIGGAAANACGELNAVAYAIGNRIAFSTSPDLHTAAHEAAHVIQQRAGVSLAAGIDTPDDAYERHANAVADLVVRGASAEALLDQVRGSGGGQAVQRQLGAGQTAGAQQQPAQEPNEEEVHVAIAFSRDLATFRQRVLADLRGRVEGEITPAVLQGAGLEDIHQRLVDDGVREPRAVHLDLRLRRDPNGNDAPRVSYRLHEAMEPDRDTTRAVDAQLNSGSGADSSREPWDGAADQPDFQANRDRLRDELLPAMATYLTERNALVTDRQEQLVQQGNVVPMSRQGGQGVAPTRETGVTAIAEAARRVLLARYAGLIQGSARTARETNDVTAPLQQSGSGQNLFNAYDQQDRRATHRPAGSTETPDQEDGSLARSIAFWIAQNPVGDVPRSHNFTWGDNDAVSWIAANVIDPFTASHRDALLRYRRYNVAENTHRGITMLTTYDEYNPDGRYEDEDHDGQNDHQLAQPIARDEAERIARWRMFRTYVHELTHRFCHSGFRRADQYRSTLREGFTEMFAQAAAQPAIEEARAGSNAELRTDVEGAAGGTGSIADYTINGTYAESVRRAVEIRDRVGEDAVRRAYFQGHVELLGLDEHGRQAIGGRADGEQPALTVPAGITSLSQLAAASGVAADTIREHNPGIDQTMPASAVLPGCREHRVIQAQDRREWGQGNQEVVMENRSHIAAQHGVSEQALAAANPQLDWNHLSFGQTVLIPVH